MSTTSSSPDSSSTERTGPAGMGASHADDTSCDLTTSDVVRLREGNAETATRLDSLYRDRLLRFCWGYLGSMEEAEDAVQDIWHKVLRASDVPQRFRPWVYKIARNHCSNLIRDRGRRKDRAVLPPASEVDAALTGHLTRLVNHEDISRLRDLVQRLTDAHREALRLRYVEGLSFAEIGEVFEVRESVAKSRVFEAMKRLRELAARHGGLKEG